MVSPGMGRWVSSLVQLAVSTVTWKPHFTKPLASQDHRMAGAFSSGEKCWVITRIRGFPAVSGEGKLDTSFAEASREIGKPGSHPEQLRDGGDRPFGCATVPVGIHRVSH